MHLHDEAGRGQAPPLLYAPQRTASVYGRGTPISVHLSRFSRATDSGGLPSLVTLSAAKGLTHRAQRSFAALSMTDHTHMTQI